ETLLQSHSSSSATSCARPVSVPWPISERAMRITQVSSGLTTTHAPISAPAALMFFMSRLLSSGHVHRRADPLIGAAPADVGHRVVDVLVGRLRLLRQERGRRPRLPGVAVPALPPRQRRPRLLAP